MVLKEKKKISIRRMDVEKMIVALRQIVEPVKTGEPFRIIVDYNPEHPTVKISILEEHQKQDPLECQ